MTKTTYEPRKDTRSADFPKTTAEKHNHFASLATTQASLAIMPHRREKWLQITHNHKLAAAEAEAEAKTSERREALAEILKTVEKDGLKGPRDLDVALDAIEDWFKEASKP
jgi:hypothetical protein